MQPSGERPVIISFRLEHVLGWGLTIGFCVVPIVLWLQIHPFSNLQTFSAIMLALGQVTGLVGMIMYALNLVYATRLRALEYLFGGLNRVYIAHHVLGGLALVLLSLHPLFLALRYVKTSLEQSALLLLPNGLFPLSALFDTSHQFHETVLEQWAVFFGIIAFWGMVGLLLVTFFVKIPYRIWLFTHKFLGLAFFIGGLHVLFISSDTSTDTALKVYILGFTLIGIAAFIYKTLLGRILIKKYNYQVSDVKLEAGNVTHIELLPVGLQMSYKPGQFVFARFTGAKDQGINHEWHPFSISSSPNDPALRLSVKGLGDYTNVLSRLPVGSAAEIEGAYGSFTNTDYSNRNQIWIAGGIGVTPFISMAKSLPETGYNIDLYYSVKTSSELIDWQTLYDIAMVKNGTFRVIPWVGDRQQAHLSADYVEKISGNVSQKDVFICGPPAMMQSLRKQFRDKGVPGTNIHSEEFGMV